MYTLSLLVILIITSSVSHILSSFVLNANTSDTFLKYSNDPITTNIVAIVGSWIGEHEADMESVRKVGVAPLIRALIKTNVLSRYRLFIKRVEFNEMAELSANIRFRDILTLFLKYSLVDAPKEAVSFVLKPTYPTHPPVILRFFKASLSLKGEKGESNLKGSVAGRSGRREVFG